MYITSYDSLRRALDERHAVRHETRARVDAFIEATYGVKNMSSMLREFFPFISDEKPTAILARQLASMCAEDVAFEIVAKRFNLSPVTPCFVRDAFTMTNHDKVCRVNIPWVTWSKKGNKMLKYDRICEQPNEKLQNTPLDRIVTKGGDLLPQYHAGLRARSGLTGLVSEVDRFHAYMLEHARFRPEFVYREIDGLEVRHELAEDDAVQKRDRPPAQWYYPYYLSWFVDGSMVLFETFADSTGNYSPAEKKFRQWAWQVEHATGFAPLIVKIPSAKDLLECNTHLLDAPAALSIIAEQTAQLSDENTEQLFHAIGTATSNYH